MLVPLVLLFLVIPVVEIYVIIQIGQEIGALWTVLILVADSIVGSMLVRAQGRAAWQRLVAAISRGRIPTREAIDGVLVVFGGALLLAPGFITDAFGLLLLLPPTRALVRRALARRAGGRAGLGRAGRDPSRRAEPDVEGSATELDPRLLP